ncbi:MAG: hypothetical protein HW387_550 [Parachlamydiales bacterium]|nr:hypothetical protein [Parachlamydiales bacterium]
MISPICDQFSSTALLERDPTLSDVQLVEEKTNAVFKRFLEIAKNEPSLFPQIQIFTGPNSVSISSRTFSTTEGLGTDPSIGVEIFTPVNIDKKRPVIIFSHGMGVSSDQYRLLLGQLASHGYVVLSLTHLSSVKDLPDVDDAARATAIAPVVANNIQYVLQQVRIGELKEIGNADKIFLAGHSLGGAASVMVARTDAGVAGCVNLDGSLHGTSKTDGLKQPLLILRGDYSKIIKDYEESSDVDKINFAVVMKRFEDELQELVRNSPQSKIIEITGACHMDFSDRPFQDYLTGTKSWDSAMKVHTFVSRDMLTFLSSSTR